MGTSEHKSGSGREDDETPDDEAAAAEGDRGGDDGDGNSRRDFLSRAAGIGAGGGLLLGYGAFALTAGKYVYPSGGAPRVWMFVRELSAFKKGESITYVGPQGESIAIARLAAAGGVEDFVALSTTCPHLGCQVSWQATEGHFFCPCHNGVFDSAGVGLSGPPAKAGQSLSRYPLKVENGLLFIEVPAADTRAARAAPSAEAISLAEGRDACLGPQPGMSLPVARDDGSGETS